MKTSVTRTLEYWPCLAEIIAVAAAARREPDFKVIFMAPYGAVFVISNQSKRGNRERSTGASTAAVSEHQNDGRSEPWWGSSSGVG
ncbi:hypothetical protein V6N11_050967 [Hibiscus sabdariffa]|uniref:Uncharacterized protein n=1 Tax=Hibiscus sabdariffa TaxID=183260 RepID=A0ABR2R2X1_9ROSI